MSIEIYERSAWTPKTEADKALVRRQLQRLLSTSHFNNSKRYPALFQFIVEETLEGRGEFLKERLLGVRVFDRPADYDTAADPIVRVTISEIRKRIAQYYHEEAHEAELRIELIAGRYEPEFRLRSELPPEHATASTVQPAPFSLPVAPLTEPVLTPQAVIQPRSRFARISLVTLGVFALSALGFLGWRWLHPPAADQFWAPLLAARQNVTFCLPKAGGPQGTQAAATVISGELVTKVPADTSTTKAQKETFLEYESLGENVVFSDVRAAMKISDVLAARGRDSRFILSQNSSLDDLREGPLVLVGGLDNVWTMRALAPLRFHFAGSNQAGFHIVDSKDPQRSDWALNLHAPLSQVSRDYGIIARIHDPTTGEVEVLVAGIGMSATEAAGGFLADPQQMEQLRSQVGPGFAKKDFEVVLSNDVVNGLAGSPKILAVTSW